MRERDASAIERIPPQNIGVEQSVLGSMMLERSALLKGLEMLRVEDFYRPANGEVFISLEKLMQREEPVDLITVQEELRKRGKLDDVGGTEYLMALVDSVPTAANIEYYAGIVKRLSDRRAVISACTEIIGMAQNEEECNPIEALIGRALSFKTNLGVRLRSQNEVVNSVYSMIDDWGKGICSPCVPTGIPGLDKILNGGVHTGEVLTVAGESGGGKSVLLGSIIDQAGQQQTPTLVFSYDMDAEDYQLRLMCARASIDSNELKRGEINWDMVAHYSGDMYGYPITWEDLPCSLEQLVAISNRWALANVKDGNGLIVVDYIQRVSVSKKTASRTEEVGEIARGIKNIARSLHLSVATASQFKKNKADSRGSRDNSDLRDNKAIEDEADKIILIRPDKLVVSKHRRGATGSVRVNFHKQYTRFEEIDERYSEDEPKQSGWVNETW